jgi:transcriptional regulator with XRE-family HTH domain
MHAVSHQKVKNLRLDNGWTQDQLARITSLSYRTIQRIEKDGRCSLDSKMALSSAFGISFSELSSGEATLLDRLFSLRFVQDGAGTYKSVAADVPEMLQVPMNQIVGKNCADILPTELSNQILKAIADLKNGAKLIEFDYSLTLTAGPQFFRAKIINSGHDSFLSVITEIEQQKATEKKLLKSEAMLSKVADTLKSGAWEVDLTTNEILWTKQIFAIYEVDKTPTISEGILFYAPQARPIIQQAFEQLTTSGISYDLELPFITAKGRDLWVRVVGWAEYHETKITKVSGVIQDITHLKPQN